MRKRTFLATAVGAVVAIGLSACGGGGGGASTGEGGGAEPAFNAAIDKVWNPSDKKGGTLSFAYSGEWDSLDPGNTYYGYSWNFVRLYTRQLVMFKPGPAKESQEIVGDLAEGKGVASDGNKTWTYKLKPGLKYDDGTPITSKDVAYGVLRSVDKTTFPNGPTYFDEVLALPEGYKGPFTTPDIDASAAIQTPDDQTIVFKLNKPIGAFDQLAQLPMTSPVPKAKDTGAKYQESIVSSGPYKFENYQSGKSFALVRNTNWDPATDPNRKALPDRIEVALNVEANDIDNRLISGDLQVDVEGSGVRAAALPTILNDPTLKDRTDNPTTPRLWYTSINPQIAPLDNVECRRAVIYATDKIAYQSAQGGDVAGGDIATTVIPPLVPGYKKADPYPAGPNNTGDLDKAKQALAACGQPNGFQTSISYRNERPKEKAVAEALQQALARVGIQLNIKGFPAGGYFSQYAGLPPFAREQGLGLVINGWQSDWNDPYAFLQQIVDSRVIRETGGSSNISVRIPEVDAMLDQMVVSTDEAQRIQLAEQIDAKVLEQAEILPGVYAKALIVRGSKLTNVYYNEQYGMYDYTALGVTE
jgi:peptide/nickel transport system substrate-binding protein